MKTQQDINYPLLEGLSSPLAIVGQEENLVAVNAAWQQSSSAMQFLGRNCEPGENYLEACTSHSTCETISVERVVQGIRDVLSHRRSGFFGVYSAVTEPESVKPRQWFHIHVVPVNGPLGDWAIILHELFGGRIATQQFNQSGSIDPRLNSQTSPQQPALTLHQQLSRLLVSVSDTLRGTLNLTLDQVVQDLQTILELEEEVFHRHHNSFVGIIDDLHQLQQCTDQLIDFVHIFGKQIACPDHEFPVHAVNHHSDSHKQQTPPL